MHGRAGFPGVWSSKGSKTVVGGAGLQFVCQGRAIKRAFEVEDTTSVYSGTLRMADLLALQPNMNIRFHIVAPISRREKVFQGLRRAVFSRLDRGPLSESCTYLPYGSAREVTARPRLLHLPDRILEKYAEVAED